MMTNTCALSFQMLSESIMHDCIIRLLRSSSDEESLECFCVLITTTGKDLEHQKSRVYHMKDNVLWSLVTFFSY